MKHLAAIIAATITLTALPALTAPPDPSGTGAPAAEEILAQTYAFARTWNTGRVDDYIAKYEQSEDFALYYSGGQQRGITAARALYHEAWPTEHAMGKFEVFDVRARLLSPTTALSHGLFQHRFPDKTVNGNFTIVWILAEGGHWKIAHEHSARISVEEPD